MSLFGPRVSVDRWGRRYIEQNGQRYYEDEGYPGYVRGYGQGYGRPQSGVALSWPLVQGGAVGVLALITGLVLGLGFLAFVLALVLGGVVYAVRRR